MKISSLLAIPIILMILLVSCQQPAPDPRLSDIVINSAASAAGIDALSSDIDVLTAGMTSLSSEVSGLRSDVQDLTSEAQELSSLTAQVQSLAGILSLVNPATTGLLNVQFDSPLQLIATPGACSEDLPEASTQAGSFSHARAIAFMGLPVGQVCLASVEPPAGVTLTVAAKQMLSVYFALPDE